MTSSWQPRSLRLGCTFPWTSSSTCSHPLSFIQGRGISSDVLYHLGLAEHLLNMEYHAALILTDLANAYDSVDWGWLADVMRNMGF